METLRLPAKMESLDAFRSFVTAGMEKLDISPELLFKVELVLEEALTNVIHYAYLEEPGEVELEFGTADNRLCFKISDWGKPFNPLERPDPEIDADILERPIGGLGIFLIRRMVDELSYERREDRNMLTFCFNI